MDKFCGRCGGSLEVLVPLCCGVVLKSSYCTRCGNPSLVIAALKIEEEPLEMDWDDVVDLANIV